MASTQKWGDEESPDQRLIIKHHDRSDSHLIFVSINDIWVLVIRKFNDGRMFTRLQKAKHLSGEDDELLDMDPII